MLIVGFKGMAEYLEKNGHGSFHPDTLRKAVDDDRNPLRVEFDNGSARIHPGPLVAWREARKGLRRRPRRAASKAA